MEHKTVSRSAFFSPRVTSSATCVLLALLAFGLNPGGNAFAQQTQSSARDLAKSKIRSLRISDAAQRSGNKIAPDHTSMPAAPLVASCTKAVLVNDGSTSGNARAPITKFGFERAVYLITATEMAAAGYTNGSSPTVIGWNYSTAPTVAGSAPLIVYMQNTADTTNTKSTTWATAISGMTIAHNATTALPAAAGPFDITLTGGSTFTYTGGGLYIAFDWGQYAGTLDAAVVVSCNSTGLVSGLKGAQSSIAAPTTIAASSFRPETRLNGAPTVANDAAVTAIYSYGQVPFGLVPPQATGAVVNNNGANSLTSLPITLNVTGADTFTNMQTIPSVTSCGGQSSAAFASFTPGVIGTDTITASVPADDVNANNTLSRTMNITSLTYDFKFPGSTTAGGVGFTTTVGALVGKFTINSANAITAVTVEFNTVTATTYRVAIYGDNAGMPSLTALYVDAADRTVTATGPVTITLPSPVAVPAGSFYAGIHQTNTTNASMGYDNEVPIRSGTFFEADTTLPPTAWFDFSPGGNFKLNVGVTLQTPAATPTAPAITNGPPTNPVIVGTPYSFTFTTTGSPAPTFTLTGGTLPTGLTLSSAGVLSGTCTNGGTGSFPSIMVTASNATLPNATQTFTLNTVTKANNYIASFGLTGGGAALTADPDRDGITNLMEYALGLNPNQNSLVGLPTVTLKNYSGTIFLSMLFHRSSLATDLTYIVQGSSDLVSWTNLGTSAAGGVTSGTGFVTETGSAPNFTVEVKDTVPYDPLMLNKRFMRLMITSP